MLPGAEDADERVIGDAGVGVRESPAVGVMAGLLSARCRAWWARCRGLVVVDFGDRRAGCGFVDDGLAGGVGGDEGLQGEVVDCPRVAAGGGVQERGGVVGE